MTRCVFYLTDDWKPYVNMIQSAEAMARWCEHGRQEVGGAGYVNGSACLAAVEPSICRVQILSSEGGGWRQGKTCHPDGLE